MSHQFIEKTPSSPEGLSCKFYLRERSGDDKIDVLIVSFFGDYPKGSLGNEHGSFIARKAIEGLMSFSVEAIILDFREMNYTYGNTLLKVFEDIYQYMDAGNDDDDPIFPILVVLSDKNRTGILSLLTPVGSESMPDFCFDDMDEAIAEATEKGAYWLDN